MLHHHSPLVENIIVGFNENPFHKTLGLTFSVREDFSVTAQFGKQLHVLGNVRRQMVHGGAIAGVFDCIGGVLCAVNIIKLVADEKKRVKRLGRLCTIDLKTDFLRPARAKQFEAEASVVRMGASIITTHMRLCDERGREIAICSGNFMY